MIRSVITLARSSHRLLSARLLSCLSFNALTIPSFLRSWNKPQVISTRCQHFSYQPIVSSSLKLSKMMSRYAQSCRKSLTRLLPWFLWSFFRNQLLKMRPSEIEWTSLWRTIWNPTFTSCPRVKFSSARSKEQVLRSQRRELVLL